MKVADCFETGKLLLGVEKLDLQVFELPVRGVAAEEEEVLLDTRTDSRPPDAICAGLLVLLKDFEELIAYSLLRELTVEAPVRFVLTLMSL